MATVNKISLEDPTSASNAENSVNKDITLNGFLKQNPNIIVKPGVNWCHLFQVSEEQLCSLQKIFARDGVRYTVGEKSVGLQGHLSHVISHRKWFQDPKCLPGKKEKAWLIAGLEEAKRSKKRTGIAPEAYDELLEKLYSLPDTEDIEGYALSFHY